MRRLRGLRGPPSAFDLQAYCGSPLPVLGVRVPRIRELARTLLPPRVPVSTREILRRADELWGGRVLEERLLAIELLARARPEPWTDTWRVADRWLPDATGWALSDALSMQVLGPLVFEHPTQVRTLGRWARSPDPWRRRASVYALHRFVRKGTLRVPLAQIDRLLEDPDPWVQRAVGTWLRESWKKDPRRIEAVLRARAPRLSAIARTVATERAPRSFRQELRDAARGSPPRVA